MIHKQIVFTSALLAATACGFGVTQAQTLGGLVGGKGSDSLVTLGSANAGNSGAVNVGLGGESLADVNLGSGSDTLGNVNVSSGGGQGLADVDVGLGDSVRAHARLGGDDLLDLDLGVGTSGGGAGSGGGGTGGAAIAGLGSGANGAAPGAGCDAGISADAAGKLIRSGDYAPRAVSAWGRAASVELMPVAMCPQMRVQVRAALSRSGLAGQIQQAALGDSLVSASLSRTRYDAGDVLAIRHAGSKLIVYVY